MWMKVGNDDAIFVEVFMASVLSVGQCGYDDSRIGRVVREATGAFLERAGSVEDAQQMMAAKKYGLILVNRVFDSGGEGLPFIEQLKKSGDETPVMLVSDYADAQAKAVASGALLGFGKSGLATPDVAEKIRVAVESSASVK